MRIKEVYESMNEPQRVTLRVEIMRLGKSYATVRAWCMEERRPDPVWQKIVAKTVSRATGRNYTAEELFGEEQPR